MTQPWSAAASSVANLDRRIVRGAGGDARQARAGASAVHDLDGSWRAGDDAPILVGRVAGVLPDVDDAAARSVALVADGQRPPALLVDELFEALDRVLDRPELIVGADVVVEDIGRAVARTPRLNGEEAAAARIEHLVVDRPVVAGGVGGRRGGAARPGIGRGRIRGGATLDDGPAVGGRIGDGAAIDGGRVRRRIPRAGLRAARLAQEGGVAGHARVGRRSGVRRAAARDRCENEDDEHDPQTAGAHGGILFQRVSLCREEMVIHLTFESRHGPIRGLRDRRAALPRVEGVRSTPTAVHLSAEGDGRGRARSPSRATFTR